MTADLVRRIWARDPTVWTDDPSQHAEIANRLGWLTAPATMPPHVPDLRAFAEEVRARYRRVVLIGMGGSSLAPEVLWRTFGPRQGFPTLHLVDSTDPEAVHAVSAAAPLGETLFVVASKSGSTLETDALFKHFWAQAPRGEQFVAITDPGTSLAELARSRRFHRAFLNPADVGGRFSALTLFGLVPAALIGVDIARLLERAREMARLCGPETPPQRNPGYLLGGLLGGAAPHGRDKATVWLAPELGSLGSWIEQLLAESTGKDGKGVLPVVDEPVAAPDAYGPDRLFLIASLEGGSVPVAEEALKALIARGAPVEGVTLRDRYDLGAEFFRWEFATAVAGAMLRVNPFDQPNVAESKRNTAEIITQMETRGARLETPAALTKQAVARWLDVAAAASYVAILAYVPPTPANDRHLAELRRRLRDRLSVVATAGYGPRYLHSTGQYHKGGPQTGAFLLVTTEHERDVDVDVPATNYTFSALEEAQALGDWEALHRRGRPVLRMHLTDRRAGLGELVERIGNALEARPATSV